MKPAALDLLNRDGHFRLFFIESDSGIRFLFYRISSIPFYQLQFRIRLLSIDCESDSSSFRFLPNASFVESEY